MWKDEEKSQNPVPVTHFQVSPLHILQTSKIWNLWINLSKIYLISFQDIFLISAVGDTSPNAAEPQLININGYNLEVRDGGMWVFMRFWGRKIRRVDLKRKDSKENQDSAGAKREETVKEKDSTPGVRK